MNFSDPAKAALPKIEIGLDIPRLPLEMLADIESALRKKIERMHLDPYKDDRVLSALECALGQVHKLERALDQAHAIEYFVNFVQPRR
jgi:hypothetical protein